MQKLLKQFIRPFAILSLSFFIGCQQPGEKRDVAADIAAINAFNDIYCEKANAGDLDSWLSLWLDDAIRMEPNTPAIIGKENIRAHFKVPFEQFKTEIATYGETEIEVNENWAFSRGTFTLTLTPKSGGPTTYIDGKWLDILKRQTDGSWKIYIDMVNYNAPPKVE